MKVCSKCGQVADPASRTNGSIWIEVVLWLCFIVPGLIYSIWRLTTRHDVCPSCGSADLLPIESPRGKQLVESSGYVPEPARKPSPAARGAGLALGRAVRSLMGR